MNKIIAIVALSFAFAAANAQARETGIINQAGPYEATMHFYLHPAHGFDAVAEAATQQSTAIAKQEPTTTTMPAPQPAERDTQRLARTTIVQPISK